MSLSWGGGAELMDFQYAVPVLVDVVDLEVLLVDVDFVVVVVVGVVVVVVVDVVVVDTERQKHAWYRSMILLTL